MENIILSMNVVALQSQTTSCDSSSLFIRKQSSLGT